MQINQMLKLFIHIELPAMKFVNPITLQTVFDEGY